MIIFKSKSERDTYVMEQINYLLGIEFIDDVHFIINQKFEHIFFEKRKMFIFISESEIQKNTDNIIYIQSDIASKIFNYFSLRNEESKERDRLNRTIFSHGELNRLKEPIIDREVFRIRQKICKALDQRKIRYNLVKWSDKPVVCLTHDVDSLKAKSFVRALYWIFNGLKGNRLFQAIKKSWVLYKAPFDEHGAFEKFIEIEKSFSFRSTYFFLSLPFFLGREGRRYRLKKNLIKKNIQALLDQQFEVGLHTTRKGSNNPNFLKNELSRLNSVLEKPLIIQGVRNHYLAGSFQDIWKTYESFGFLYDSTLGWHDFNGYRSGTSMPFVPFNHKEGRAYNLYELPQIVMDGAIEDGSSSNILEEVKFYIDHAKNHNSALTISWHTNRICSTEYSNYSEAYLSILEYLKDAGFISMTASEIIKKYISYEKKMKKNLDINYCLT